MKTFFDNLTADIYIPFRGHFGDCDEEFFGAKIPITAIVADQQGAMFGQCCFDEGDCKLSMGTASCVTINTGTIVHASLTGGIMLLTSYC